MNLWFRLLCYLAGLPWRPKLILPGDVSVLHFRVWPLDLDTSLHMNNGRYLTLMDLGRFDVMSSSGLLQAVMRHKWTPIASTIQIRFRRELRLFVKFRLETTIESWAETHVVMRQTFFIESGPFSGHVAAVALFKGGLYDRAERAFVPTKRLMHEIGVDEASPDPEADIVAFLESDDVMRQALRAKDTD